MIYLSFLYWHYTTFTCITCWHTFSSFILLFYCIYLLTAECHVFSWYISFIIWYPYMFLVTINKKLIIITHTHTHTSLYFFVWPVQDSEILVICVLCVSQDEFRMESGDRLLEMLENTFSRKMNIPQGSWLIFLSKPTQQDHQLLMALASEQGNTHTYSGPLWLDMSCLWFRWEVFIICKLLISCSI